MPIPLEEQETIVTGTNAQDTLEIYSSIRRHITAMRKHPTFTEVESGFEDASEWARFRIPLADWNPATGGRRRREMTEEQRAELSARARKNLARQHKTKGEKND